MRVGKAEIELIRIRPLDLDIAYIISRLQKIETRYGYSMLTHSKHPTNNSPVLKTFLPGHCVDLLPDDEAVAEFMRNINRITITALTSNNSVDFEFSQVPDIENVEEKEEIIDFCK